MFVILKNWKIDKTKIKQNKERTKIDETIKL